MRTFLTRDHQRELAAAREDLDLHVEELAWAEQHVRQLDAELIEARAATERARAAWKAATAKLERVSVGGAA